MKLLVCMIVWLFAIQYSKAQTPVFRKDATLVFDFLKGDLHPGDFYILNKKRISYRIINFNKQLYNISVSMDQRALFAEQPPIFGVITDLDLSKLKDAAAENAIVEADGSGIMTEISRKNTGSAQQAIIDKYKKLKTEVLQLSVHFDLLNGIAKELSVLYKNLSGYLMDGCHTYDDIAAAKIKDTRAYLLPKIVGVAADELSLKGQLEANANSLFTDINETAEKIRITHQQLKSQYALLEKTILAEIDKEKQQLKKTPSVTRSKSVADQEIELATEKAGLDDINENIAVVKARAEKLDEMNEKGFVKTLIDVYGKINRTSFEYVSPSYKATEDEMTIKINIEPKEPLACNSNYSIFNGEYTGTIYGFKINFSSGIFAIMGKKLFDQTYRVDPIDGDPDNNIILKNKSRRKIQPSLGALMHFYWKQPSFVSFGGVLGLSVSNQSLLNYHGGLSLLFGETQRIIVSGGATLSQAKDLTEEYQENQKVAKSLNLTTVPTQNYYRWGSFISITYNLKPAK
ncbi:hypothetical protein [Ferruginibacter sp. HRS2-29]|uniref:hypothetical protein n=1 Tax=Ferruginibacter sp. HRS2-29 TaxID=2487334 RepID=UPI0020CC5874|nr:hypothetical protein [Ferruginibacter sp. HRS2-29]